MTWFESRAEAQARTSDSIRALREAKAYAEIAFYLALAATGRDAAVTREADDILTVAVRALRAAEDAAGIDSIGAYYDNKGILARAWSATRALAESGELAIPNLDQRRLLRVIESQYEMACYAEPTVLLACDAGCDGVERAPMRDIDITDSGHTDQLCKQCSAPMVVFP